MRASDLACDLIVPSSTLAAAILALAKVSRNVDGTVDGTDESCATTSSAALKQTAYWAAMLMPYTGSLEQVRRRQDAPSNIVGSCSRRSRFVRHGGIAAPGKVHRDYTNMVLRKCRYSMVDATRGSAGTFNRSFLGSHWGGIRHLRPRQRSIGGSLYGQTLQVPFFAPRLTVATFQAWPAACNYLSHIHPPRLLAGPSVLADDARRLEAIFERESQPPFCWAHILDLFAMKSVSPDRALQHDLAIRPDFYVRAEHQQHHEQSEATDRGPAERDFGSRHFSTINEADRRELLSQ